jgi:hypothetical protein
LPRSAANDSRPLADDRQESDEGSRPENACFSSENGLSWTKKGVAAGRLLTKIG